MHTKHQVPWRTTFTTIALLLIYFFLLSYTSSLPRVGLSPRAVTADGDQLQQNAVGGLTKRVTDTYSKSHDKGHWLHCRMSMTKEEAKESNRGESLEAPFYLQVDGLEEPEGWSPREASSSLFKDDLNEALRALSIPIDFHHESWSHTQAVAIFNEPSWLIDDRDDVDVDVDDVEQGVWSDAAWMQWAILNKHARDGKGKTIGTWHDRITMTIREDPDELYGILGSPNGAGAAYLLLNHKERLGLKIINKVDIFVAEGSYEVTSTSISDVPESIMLLFHVTDV
ncbi:hypothetical protein FPSE_00949 [Fusarium pseudograminearum CS3096]|uniref:Uncharacterized protein n=1 Tax=Fusarium pseudograminearum (strain CS3096) TaxID=1028729 RepID=K3V0Z7_FUSPC|nr:hypothetical protein FPSE_00949 [Fusarium pseudograminearum CS3096]EKJ78806.1 hypothetical protein FPSE_00949 [Fusarium pseudograminearum CS3096]